jgi:hypothetical protein
MATFKDTVMIKDRPYDRAVEVTVIYPESVSVPMCRSDRRLWDAGKNLSESQTFRSDRSSQVHRPPRKLAASVANSDRRENSNAVDVQDVSVGGTICDMGCDG